MLRFKRNCRPEFVLVTASDTTHAKSLVQLLRSIRQYETGTRVIVYDLGLTWRERWQARRSCPCTIRKFRYERYPDYLNINVARGEYAWKPVIVNEIARMHQGVVCWMDAGNVLTGDLSAVREFVAAHGFYSPRSSGTVADWTHPGMLEWLRIPADWEGQARRNLNAACIAFDTRNSSIAALITEWARLALIKDCIAPPGSSRKNHRQDQALLTVLAYRSGLIVSPAAEKLGFRTHADRR